MSEDWGWLSELRAGDEVIVETSHYGSRSRAVRVVESVTKQRVRVRITSTYVQEFRKTDGRENKRWSYSGGSTLVQITPESRASVMRADWRARAVATIEGTQWSKESDEVLRTVLATLTPDSAVKNADSTEQDKE